MNLICEEKNIALRIILIIQCACIITAKKRKNKKNKMYVFKKEYI